MSPQEVYELFSRHEVTEYNGDVARARGVRWRITCRCGFTTGAPEYSGAEFAFGTHILNDPAFGVGVRETGDQ